MHVQTWTPVATPPDTVRFVLCWYPNGGVPPKHGAIQTLSFIYGEWQDSHRNVFTPPSHWRDFPPSPSPDGLHMGYRAKKAIRERLTDVWEPPIEPDGGRVGK